jgi:hypothetical protein
LAKLVYKREKKKRRKKLLDEFPVQPTKIPSKGSVGLEQLPRSRVLTERVMLE